VFVDVLGGRKISGWLRVFRITALCPPRALSLFPLLLSMLLRSKGVIPLGYDPRNISLSPRISLREPFFRPQTATEGDLDP